MQLFTDINESSLHLAPCPIRDDWGKGKHNDCTMAISTRGWINSDLPLSTCYHNVEFGRPGRYYLSSSQDIVVPLLRRWTRTELHDRHC